jgi:S1-C subfamily serine protease
MIMGGSGFEEAEEVAKRLFRLKTAVQRDDGKFDGSKRTAAATNRGGDQDDNGEKIVVEIELQRPLGFALKEVAGYGIYVDSVMAGGSAEKMGVQRGDRVLATSATVGGGMWEKSTMDGVLSALHSGTLFSNTVRIRFERDPVLASIVGFSAESSTSRVDLSRALLSVERARLRVQQTTTETFEVALPLPGKEKSFLRGESPFNGQLPYGVRLAEDDEGVYVAHIAPHGTAADSRLLRVGDRIVATQGSTGEKLWPKKTLSGILSATNTRLSSSITFQIERKVQRHALLMLYSYFTHALHARA